MKTAYFDCIAGASGDMLLGALIDAGLPAADLEAELAKLHLDDFHLHVGKVAKNAFTATKVDVHVHDHAPERHLRDIREVVEQSDVSDKVKQRALRVFTRICEEEAAIHGMSVDDVHLHEVGGVDAIVDVVGVLAGIELMGIEKIAVSPLPMGRGFIKGAHGQIPLPAPATLGLLKLTNHDLRAWFATYALQQGVDVATVADWLGDSAEVVLRRYASIMTAHKKTAATLLK